MSVGVKDILIKAAEDVQSGMWCKGDYFGDRIDEKRNVVEPYMFGPSALFAESGGFEYVANRYRCAEASLALVTWQLGGSEHNYCAALRVVNDTLAARYGGAEPPRLHEFNDYTLPDDPFEAGQALADLFREAADV